MDANCGFGFLIVERVCNKISKAVNSASPGGEHMVAHETQDASWSFGLHEACAPGYLGFVCFCCCLGRREG